MFVLLDHITSPSAIVFPVKKLIDLCKKYNVISVVDGAHAPGQLKLSMKELKPDYYVGMYFSFCGFKTKYYQGSELRFFKITKYLLE